MSGALSPMNRRLSLGMLMLVCLALGTQGAFVSAQVNARPAAVMLVATLETLSLGVSQNVSLNERTSKFETVQEQSLHVIANWAVPARLTTFRLEVLAPGKLPGEQAHVLWQQPAGESNRPDSLVKVMQIENSLVGMPSKKEGVSSLMTFQIEAL